MPAAAKRGAARNAPQVGADAHCAKKKRALVAPASLFQSTDHSTNPYGPAMSFPGLWIAFHASRTLIVSAWPSQNRAFRAGCL